MIGLDIDGYGEWLNIECTECGWTQTLHSRDGWYGRGEPPYVLEDIFSLAGGHECGAP